MDNIRLDGAYLSSNINIENNSFFGSSKIKTISYNYFLFYNNKESNLIELYRGTISGDFIKLMEWLSFWKGSPWNIANKFSVLNSNTIYFKNYDPFLKKDIENYLILNDSWLRYESEYLREKNISSEKYIFFPFPSYFFLEKKEID